MGKRYYCDYCDRSFVDEIQARKKHLNGASHLRNRKLHYSECRDMKTLIQEESAKEECYKFKSSGQCAFGENCYRSHFSKQQLQMFRNKLTEEEKQENARLIGELRTVDSWLLKQNMGITQCEVAGVGGSAPSMPYASLTSLFRSHLPPSLQRDNLTGFSDTELCDWG